MKKINRSTLTVMWISLFILFANFAESSELQPFKANGNVISLEGKWLFHLDNKEKEGVGLKEGWEKSDFDDSQWKSIQVGTSWEKQGYNYNGVAWYRQKVFIPESWKNDTLLFNLGRPDDRGEVYFNGEKVAEVKKFGPHFVFKIPQGKIKFGALNSIGIRIVDWYKSGGLNDGNFSIRRFAPLGTSKTNVKIPEPMKLSLTQNLKDGLLEKSRWESGWRDGGTSDTRPRMSVERKAFNEQDAIVMDVWYPNTQEYVDYYLQKGEKGRDWKKKGYDYLSFWYKSDIGGEIKIKLNKGKIRWGKGGTTYTARVFIQPGGWEKVILPFSAFVTKPRHNSAPTSLTDPSYADTLVIGFGNHELQKAGKIRFTDFQVGAFDINLKVSRYHYQDSGALNQTTTVQMGQNLFLRRKLKKVKKTVKVMVWNLAGINQNSMINHGILYQFRVHGKVRVIHITVLPGIVNKFLFLKIGKAKLFVCTWGNLTTAENFTGMEKKFRN